MKEKIFDIVRAVLRYLLLGIIAFIMIFPFWWSIICSFQTDLQIYNMGLRLLPKFSELTLINYKEVFEVLDVFRYLGNTLIVSFFNIVGTLLFAYLAAYGIEIIKFRGHKVVTTILLAAMMIPGSITTVPTYRLMDNLGILDSLASLILPGMLGLGTFLFIRSFLIDIGREVRESAQLDGANELTISIILYAPQVSPALICQGVFCLLANWNNYYQPMLYLYDERNYTLALALWQKQSVLEHFGAVLGSSLLVTLPMFAVFIFAQRYFMTGIKLSGTKD